MTFQSRLTGPPPASRQSGYRGAHPFNRFKNFESTFPRANQFNENKKADQMENLTIDELLDPGSSVEIPDDLATSADLGEWLGLTSSRVNQLARDSILPRMDAPGGFAFPLKASVQAYAEHLRNRSIRSSDPRLADEKLRVAAGQADKLDIQNQKSRGELIPAAAVRAEWLSIPRQWDPQGQDQHDQALA
jgi:hypothetical protein